MQARPQDAIWAVWTFILIISVLGMLITSLRAVKLTVRDDGVGLPASVPNSGLGRASMRHRASAIGALLSVSTVAGGGTEVRLDCPQDAKTRAQRGWG